MQELQRKHPVQIQERLTHRYKDCASHLDTWGPTHQFTALGSELVSADNGYDDAGARRFTVIGSKHRSQEAQAKALRDHYSYSGCTHDYDCCGCLHTSARVIPKGRGRFSVLIRTYRNY